MARIPSGVIERLKSEIAIERLAEARGVVFERRGAGSPRPLSLPRGQDAVSRGDALEEPLALLGRLPGRRNRHRLGDAGRRGLVPARGRALAERLSPFSRCSSGASRRRSTAPCASCRRRSSAIPRMPSSLPQVIDYYHETLLQSPEALEYLARRGIGSQEAIQHLPLRLRQSHARLSAAGEDSGRGGGHPRAAAAHRALARERARALQRLDRDPGDRRERGGDGSLRPQDHARPAAGHAAASLPPWPASRRVECSGARHEPRSDPLRGADRCADLLVCGLSQRHERATASRASLPITAVSSNSAARSAC